MAINYRPGEAVKVVLEGTDVEAIKDIGKRYPLLVIAALKLGKENGPALVDLLDSIPSYVSARQMNSRLAGEGDGEGEGDGDTKDTKDEKKDEKKAPPAKKDEKKAPPAKKDEKKAPPKKDAKKDEGGDDDWGGSDDGMPDFANMENKDLAAALKERGLKATKGTSKADVVKMLEEYEKNKGAEGGSSNDDEWDV